MSFTIRDIIGLVLFYGVIALVIILIIKHRKKTREQKIEEYKQTTYFKQTGNEYSDTKRSLGKYGEFLVYDELKSLEGNNVKFIFNAYIPRDNDKYSEVDTIVLTLHGLYIIESKNYSGWIYGDKDSQYWTQTFKTSKNKFYNPIWQNYSHVKYLSSYLNLDYDKFKSIIVFSNRCTFKAVPENTDRLSIIHRRDILPVVKNDLENTDEVFKSDDLNLIYEKLTKLTNIKEAIKQKHIDSIRKEVQ